MNMHLVSPSWRPMSVGLWRIGPWNCMWVLICVPSVLQFRKTPERTLEPGGIVGGGLQTAKLLSESEGNMQYSFDGAKMALTSGCFDKLTPVGLEFEPYELRDAGEQVMEGHPSFYRTRRDT